MTAGIRTGHHFAPSRPLSPFPVGWTGKPSADGMYGGGEENRASRDTPPTGSGTPGQNSEVAVVSMDSCLGTGPPSKPSTNKGSPPGILRRPFRVKLWNYKTNKD